MENELISIEKIYFIDGKKMEEEIKQNRIVLQKHITKETWWNRKQLNCFTKMETFKKRIKKLKKKNKDPENLKENISPIDNKEIINDIIINDDIKRLYNQNDDVESDENALNNSNTTDTFIKKALEIQEESASPMTFDNVKHLSQSLKEHWFFKKYYPNSNEQMQYLKEQ